MLRMAVFSMGTVRMSQMWMLRWVVLLVGQQLIQAGFIEDYGVMGDSSDLTMWPTTPSGYFVPVRASNHVNNICSMWGNFHFKTFDGDFYQFPGTCEYNLVSDCQSVIRQFSVHVKRTEHISSPKISRVLVTINDITVEITVDKVIVNKENKLLPVHVAGILVEENTIYMRLHSKMGITVMWNKEDAVMVELDSKFLNRTCGLCGDFNRAPVYNEFIQSELGYEREVGYIEFGNKHKVPNPDVDCKNPSEEDDEQNLVDHSEKHREDCDDLLKDADWFSCNKILNPEPYIEACMNDMCLYQPEDTDNSTLCATLSEYSRQCSHAGGTPPTWRRADFCAVACPYNMVHSESGSPCMDTCLHKDTNTLCEQHNIDGCFCPPGTVFDEISNMGCIPVEECQCKHDRIYSTGEVLYKHNTECICKEGDWICTSIPGPGLCAVEEGSHFTTFDGKEFTFHGDCNYVLSKDFEESKFIILGQIVPCVSLNTDTCLKSIEVMFNNDKNHRLVIKADGTVQQNAIVSLPYTTADFTVFMPSSFHIMLQTTFGLQVQVQLVPLMQVYITVDQSFQGKTCGICGNFNKVLSDDLETPQGVVEGTAVSFANAWKTQSNCPDRTERLDDPCSYSSDIEHYAEYWCSQMKEKGSLFAQCHTTVNPDSYYKRCKYSSCTCEKSEDCLCTVFSSYARACASKGIILQGWREIVCEKYTENCPASQNYSYELQGCQRTCLSLASERQSCSVDFVPVDGCACPEGLYQDQNGLCVPMEKCPCYNNGVTVQPGTSINIKNEHCVCVNGTFRCLSWKPPIVECPPPKVFFNCSTARPDEHGLLCAQTCMQKEMDCFSQDCESGCQCPAGLLDDGRGNCVNPYDCPCPHNGQFYAPGTEITVDCNNCTCQHGTWTCTKNICPGICTIYGSGHYKTFDQQRFGFRGECSYIAAEDKCGNKTGTFHVITENIPCGTTGTTCSKAVVILLGRTKLELYGGNVTAFDTESGPQISYNKTMIGMYLVIDADIGLTVLWDRRTTVRIILQPQHMGGVCGLCGNFNGNGKDDFTTQGSLQTTDIIEFVDSWKVLGTCPDAAPDFDPCFKNLEREPWAKLQCSIIKDSEGAFKHCHNKVDPNPYYENCVKDSCACDTGGDCECFCTAMAAYAQACNEAGVCVDWRTPEICPVYCDYYNKPEGCTWHYNPCGIPCYKTCRNPFGICNNTLPNLEGCYPKCPKDEPIFDEQNQVCVKECIPRCYVNGIEYKPEENIPTDKSCHECICNEHGNIQCFQTPGCCNYGGKQYDHNDTIYNIKDDMGMCYYAVCINATVIATEKPCTTPSTFTTTTSTPMAPVSTQTPHVTSTSTGTTPLPFTTSSTTTTTPLAPTSTETPSTTSTSTGTTHSTFTTTYTTTSTPLPPTSTETPSTTSTSTGTTPSTFTTSSTTTTTPLPPTSTETPSITSTSTGTTPSTFTTSSTTTTTPLPPTSTETPSTTSTSTGTTPSTFTISSTTITTPLQPTSTETLSKTSTSTDTTPTTFTTSSTTTTTPTEPVSTETPHVTSTSTETTPLTFTTTSTTTSTPMSPVSTKPPSSTSPTTGTTPSTFTTTSTATTTPTEPVSTETPHVTSTSTETTPSTFTTTSTTTSTPLPPTSTETPSTTSTITGTTPSTFTISSTTTTTPLQPTSTETPSTTSKSTGTTPSTFTTSSTTTTTPLPPTSTEIPLTTSPNTATSYTTTSTTTSTPLSLVSTETPSSTIPSTGTTPSTFTTTSTTTTTPTGPVSTETPHVTSTSTTTTPSPFTTSSTTTTTPTEPVSTETPHVTSTSTGTTPSPFTTSSTTTTTPTEPVSTETPHVTSTSTGTSPSQFTTTSTTTSTPMSPVSTKTPSSTSPSTGTTPSTFTTTSTTTTTPTGPVSTETPHVTSTSTGTTLSTFTTFSTTTTIPTEPVSTETPHVTSTSTGTTPSPFITSSTTTTTPTETLSTETPHVTSTSTGTTPSPFTTTSTTTSTPMSPVSTKTPSSTSPTTGTTPSTFTATSTATTTPTEPVSTETPHVTSTSTETTPSTFTTTSTTTSTPLLPTSTETQSTTSTSTGTTPSTFTISSTTTTTPTEPVSTETPHVTSTSTGTTPSPFTTTSTTTSTPMSPVSTKTPSSTSPSTGTTPSTFTTTSTTTTTPTEPVSTETPHVTSTSTETTPFTFTTTSTTTSTPMSPVSTKTPSSTSPSTGTTPSTFTTTSTTTTTPTGPVSTETPHVTSTSTGTTLSTFTTFSTTTTIPTEPVSTETPHVTSTSTGTTPSPFITSSTTTTTPTEPVSTETPHVTSTSTGTTPSPFTTTSTTTSTPMSPVSTKTPSSTSPSTGTTPSTFTTTSTTTTTPTEPVSTETPHVTSTSTETTPSTFTTSSTTTSTPMSPVSTKTPYSTSPTTGTTPSTFTTTSTATTTPTEPVSTETPHVTSTSTETTPSTFTTTSTTTSTPLPPTSTETPSTTSTSTGTTPSTFTTTSTRTTTPTEPVSTETPHVTSTSTETTPLTFTTNFTTTSTPMSPVSTKTPPSTGPSTGTTPSTFTTTSTSSTTPTGPVSTETPHLTTTSTGTTPSTFTTSSTSSTTTLPPTSTETPPTTSPNTVTTYTTTSTTTTTPTEPVSTETPHVTSTSTGTTPSTFTTSSTTRTTPMPPMSTETPSSISSSTSTTPFTFTTNSTTTTTPMPSVSTETPSSTRPNTGTTPSTFTTTSTITTTSTTTTPTPHISTETTPTTSTSTGTTPITSTHTPPTSTEIPSKTSTTRSTTPTLIFTSTTTYSTNTPINIVHGHSTTPPLIYPQIVKTSVSTPFSPTSVSQSTTFCFCELQGRKYRPGESILEQKHIGSGICLTMICSITCAIQNSTELCPSPISPTPAPQYDCPRWSKTTNEIFSISKCTMAKCIKGEIIEIVPLQCPLLQKITCENHQPAVLIYDKHQCCQQYACDCFCQGWGGSHYITFDGLFYSYKGNCTYILMEEIRPQYHLKIYIDNNYCGNGELASCPRSITVSYNDQVITLRNDIGGVDLEALKDNVKLMLPYAHNGVRVISSGLDLFLSIPELNVGITFRALGFSINLPVQHFGNNTQGHCGTCNNNQADDCMIPGGILVNDCEVMADYWPASGVNGKMCQPTPKPPVLNISPPTPKAPCLAQSECNLLESKLFEACHSHVPPKNFFLACQSDICNMKNPTIVCASLQSYASACSQVGVCMHWRNYTKHCNIKCPEDKIFLPCAKSEPPTCRDGCFRPMQSITVPTEGCFCHENTILFSKESGLCVPKCGCLDPSGTLREYDEHFSYNCEDCVCDRASQSVFCKPKKCPDVNPEICTEPGFVLVNVTDPSEPCCSKQVCHCSTDMCPSGSCTKESCIYDAPDNTRHVLKNGEQYTYKCETVTCRQMNKSFVIEKNITECPYLSSKDCGPGFQYEEKVGECCGTCTQVACIYDTPDKTRHILKDGAVDNYKCETVTCRKLNGMFVTEKTKTECPYLSSFDCGPGFEYMRKEGECCGSCRQVACIYDAPDKTRHVLKVHFQILFIISVHHLVCSSVFMFHSY
ncbi:mucin-2-like, partial [Carassius auratus]|uniref:Mucin-2-like n=1 Tax=Carassius auratus TaxID=7957 RepID=A0A6P6JB22_CARAU